MEYNSMFRYLLKYVGKYRVKAYYDLDTYQFPKNSEGEIDESFDDLYIECTRGNSLIKHSYKQDWLIWYTPSIGTGRKVNSELSQLIDKEKLNYEETDSEAIIWFKDEDFNKVAKIVKPKTSGKNINPYSEKNLPDEPAPILLKKEEEKKAKKRLKENIKSAYPSVPAAEYTRLYAIAANLDKSAKMKFFKDCANSFDIIIKDKKGKDYKLDSERKKSGLKPREFIYAINLWEDYIKFCEQEYIKLSGN